MGALASTAIARAIQARPLDNRCGLDATPASHAAPLLAPDPELGKRVDLSARVLALGTDLSAGPFPVAGVTVTAGSSVATTASDGTFSLVGILSTTTVRFTYTPGDYYTMQIPASDVSGDILLMQRQNMVVQVGDVEGTREVLVAARDQFEARMYPIASTVEQSDTPRRFRWASYPIQVYVSPCSECTSDLPAAAREAIARWNEAMGAQVLVEVPAAPAIGATVVYGNTGPNIGTTVVVQPAGVGIGDAIPERVEVRLKPDGNADYMRLVVLHEMGHVLIQRHSPDRGHLMHSFVSPEQRTSIHPDELLWSTFVRFMPQGTDPDWYVAE